MNLASATCLFFLLYNQSSLNVELPKSDSLALTGVQLSNRKIYEGAAARKLLQREKDESSATLVMSA